MCVPDHRTVPTHPSHNNMSTRKRARVARGGQRPTASSTTTTDSSPACRPSKKSRAAGAVGEQWRRRVHGAVLAACGLDDVELVTDRDSPRGLMQRPSLCHVPAEEKELARRATVDTLYGEVLPAGVDTMCSALGVDAADCALVVDLGMGRGKLVLQVFLGYPGVREVVGVEFLPSRVLEARMAATHAALHVAPELLEMSNLSVRYRPSPVADVFELCCPRDDGRTRRLRLRQGDVFDFDTSTADVVICEVRKSRRGGASLFVLSCAAGLSFPLSLCLVARALPPTPPPPPPRSLPGPPCVCRLLSSSRRILPCALASGDSLGR